MGKLNGILKIQGTLDNLTFYKSADGHLVRTKGGVSKQRVMNDPAFVRTRENGVEFGHSASSGKMFRQAIGGMVFKAKDRKLTSRLVKVMSQLKNLDSVSIRGKRNVAEGLGNTEGKLLLKGFNFNDNAPMQSVLFATILVDTASGKVSIPDFFPMEQLRSPEGATHFSMQSAFLNLDFATGISDITFSDVANFPLDNSTLSISLNPTSVPVGSGTQVYLLLVEFFQEVNGVQYVLNNGSYNVLNVLDVA
ncbi:hypothetical protein ACSVH2_03025 [Flavobacterium sp. RSB2_4_14]|uniref:hypothetical protein n=1 Tax=Flavobacterium sp. RSB2_4_14 TaxID=3447665 RepID=UPI003F3AF899